MFGGEPPRLLRPPRCRLLLLLPCPSSSSPSREEEEEKVEAEAEMCLLRPEKPARGAERDTNEKPRLRVFGVAAVAAAADGSGKVAAVAADDKAILLAPPRFPGASRAIRSPEDTDDSDSVPD